MSRAVILALCAAACGHSEPFVTADQEIRGPFAAGAPLKLTYSPLGDWEPNLSGDGLLLSYQFESGQADGDRCIGLIPAGGGQRRQELCAWSLGQGTRADGLANAALRDDGMIAFTMHTGVIGNMTSNAAGLFLGPIDSVAGSIQVLPLLERPVGALTTWQDLIDPVWVSADELLVLAGARFLANLTQVCGPEDCGGRFIPYDLDRTAFRDTVATAEELARVRILNGAATVVETRAVPPATAWSFDRSTVTAFVVSRYVDPLDDFILESIADTVFRVPEGGGPLVPLYGTDRIKDNRFLERIHGIAAGHGRVFVSRSWRSPNLASAPIIGPGTDLVSDIAELLPDGSLRPLAPAVSWHWGRIRLSPDGRFLFAEAVERQGSDLYRIELAP